MKISFEEDILIILGESESRISMVEENVLGTEIRNLQKFCMSE